MRIYIVQSENNKGQEIIDLDYIFKNTDGLVEPSALDGKTVKKAYKDKVGDIIIEFWEY